MYVKEAKNDGGTQGRERGRGSVESMGDSASSRGTSPSLYRMRYIYVCIWI
jgi:hypothetical protein